MSSRHHRRGSVEGVGVFTARREGGYAYIHYRDGVKMEGPTKAKKVQDEIKKAKKQGAYIKIHRWNGEKYEEHEVGKEDHSVPLPRHDRRHGRYGQEF